MVTPTTDTIDTAALRLAVDADLGAGIQPDELLSAVNAILDVVRLQLALDTLGSLVDGLGEVLVTAMRSRRPAAEEDVFAELSRYGLAGTVEAAALIQSFGARSLERPGDVRSTLADHIGSSERSVHRLLAQAEEHLTVERLTYRNPLELVLLVGGIGGGVMTAAKGIEWWVRSWQEMRQRDLAQEFTRLEIRKAELEITAEEDKQRDAVVRRLLEQEDDGAEAKTSSILTRATIHVAVAAEVSPDNPLVLRGAAALESLPLEISVRLET